MSITRTSSTAELLEALKGLLQSHKGGADRIKGQCCAAADAAIDALAKFGGGQ